MLKWYASLFYISISYFIVLLPYYRGLAPWAGIYDHWRKVGGGMVPERGMQVTIRVRENDGAMRKIDILKTSLEICREKNDYI